MANAEKKLPADMALNSQQQNKFVEKVNKIKSKGSAKRGVVYVGHVPRGFFEAQMRQYFNQFGNVKRLKLSRSKKTGGSKGYAFVEFSSPEVAQVVADTMNNYLMFHKLLKCEFLPEERVHVDTFKSSGRGFFKPKSQKIDRKRHNQKKSELKLRIAAAKSRSRKNAGLSCLAELGIDFEYPGVVSIKSTGETTVNNDQPIKLIDNMDRPEVNKNLESDKDKHDDAKTPPPKRRKESGVSVTAQEDTAPGTIIQEGDPVSSPSPKRKKKARKSAESSIDLSVKAVDQLASDKKTQ